MAHKHVQQISLNYDILADAYSRHLSGELEGKPLDRDWLRQFAAAVGSRGPICDLGCGPGQVAGYLYEQGAQVLGIDLSPHMIERARHLHPGITFRVGNMLALEVADASWGGITAFYSIVHLQPTELTTAFEECWRVLRPGGWLLLAFHVGDEVRHVEQLWGQQVSLDFRFYPRTQVEAHLRAAGFQVVESLERDSYAGVEVATRRAYIRAHKPEMTSPD